MWLNLAGNDAAHEAFGGLGFHLPFVGLLGFIGARQGDIYLGGYLALALLLIAACWACIACSEYVSACHWISLSSLGVWVLERLVFPFEAWAAVIGLPDPTFLLAKNLGRPLFAGALEWLRLGIGMFGLPGCRIRPVQIR